MKKHIIAITCIKGGVGKSVTTGALAELAAANGKRTLVVDFDPLCALSVWHNVTGATQTAFNIFSGGTLAEAITPTGAGFDIVPGSGNLIAAERVKPTVKKTGATIGATLAAALEPVKKNYDFIFIDCPPTMGNLVTNAIMAANEVICPTETDIASIRGFLTVIDIVSQAKPARRNLRIIGAINCMYDGRANINRELRDMIQETAEENKIPYLGEVRKTVRIPEAVALRKPLYKHAPKCTAALDYLRIYNEIFE